MEEVTTPVLKQNHLRLEYSPQTPEALVPLAMEQIAVPSLTHGLSHILATQEVVPSLDQMTMQHLSQIPTKQMA
jgi:hypothetical protein